MLRLLGRYVCKTVEVCAFVSDPDVLETVVQVLEPLIVTRVQPVFPEHLEFSLRDLFGFFELHGVQLNGRVVLLLTIDNLDIYLAALRCLLVLVILLGALLLLRSVLLGNFILHNVDGTAF